MADAAIPPDGPALSKTGRPFWTGMGFQVAIGMILGVAAGLIWPEWASSLKILGDIFLKLIRTIVAPLVFLTVVSGVAAAGDVKRLGWVGAVSMVYFEILSTIALGLGLVMGMVFQVGRGIGPVAASAGAHKAASDAAATAQAAHMDLGAFVLNVFPDNFIGAFARGDLLQVLVIALIFGGALLGLKPDQRASIEGGLNTLSAAFYEFTHIVLRVAPIGAFGAIAYAVGSNGVSVLIVLAWYVVAYYLAQILFVVMVLGAVCLAFRINLFEILNFIKDEALIVFGTSSSESVLPRLLEKLPNFGASKQVVGLVLPTGYVFNLGGAAIYLSMGMVFLTNAFNVHLTFAQIAGILGLMLVTSKGVATVSGGAFVTFAATVTATGILPVEGLPMMFGVYRIMSPANATCNAVGNSIATVVIAKLCGEYDPTLRSKAA